MILRIARFSVAADEEEGVVLALRAQAASLQRPDGLEDLVFATGRPSVGMVEFVTVTLWTNEAAIERALGPSVGAPGGVAELAERIDRKCVEHFDVFADDWPELVRFLEMPLRERREAEKTRLAGSAELALDDAAPLAAIV